MISRLCSSTAFWLLVLALAILTMTDARSAETCGTLDIVTKTLKKTFGAVPRWKGQADSGNIYVIFSDAKGGAWLAVKVDPKTGESCLLVGGRRNEYMIGRET